MVRLALTLTLLALGVPTVGNAQVPVTVERDVIFSRVDGAAVLADIAYPAEMSGDLPVIMYVHGGRWRGGSRQNDAGLQVAEWAGPGWLMPLNDLVEKYRDEYNLDDIPEKAWEGVTIDDSGSEVGHQEGVLSDGR